MSDVQSIVPAVGSSTMNLIQWFLIPDVSAAGFDHPRRAREFHVHRSTRGGVRCRFGGS